MPPGQTNKNLVKKYFDKARRQKEKQKLRGENDAIKRQRELIKSQNKGVNEFLSIQKKIIFNSIDLRNCIERIRPDISQPAMSNIRMIMDMVVDGNSKLTSANLMAFRDNGQIYNMLGAYKNVDITKHIAKIERLKLLGRANNSNLFNIAKDIIFEIIEIDLKAKINST